MNDQPKPARELHRWRYFWREHTALAALLTVVLVALVSTLLVLAYGLFLTYLAPLLFGG